MFITILKYLFLVICSYIIFCKLSNLKCYIKRSISISIIVSVMVALVRNYVSSISLFLMIVIFIMIMKFLYKFSVNKLLALSIISFGFSYIVYLICFVITLPVVAIVLSIIKEKSVELIMINYIVIGVLQIALTNFILKIKRLINGMKFLINHGQSDMAVYISVSIILAASLFNMKNNADLIYIIPMFLMFIGGLILHFSWQKKIKVAYIEQLKIREFEKMKAEVEKKNEKIEQLLENNKELASIIHKDNKLIPATELLVREYISSTTQDNRGEEILKTLEDLYKERSGIVKSYETKSDNLVKTNIMLIDSTLKYMYNKAKGFNINFGVSLTGEISKIENQVDVNDLNTIVADLTENAIIATKTNINKKVLVNIGFSNNYYIEVSDSGIPFEIDTLIKMGKIQTTTHKGEGGSGIGMMTTFNLLNKYNASLIIEEFEHNTFSKKVSICFDNGKKFCIKSNRNKIIRQLTNRDDILFLN